MRYSIQVQNLYGSWHTIYSNTDQGKVAFKKKHLKRTNPMDRFRVKSHP